MPDGAMSDPVTVPDYPSLLRLDGQTVMVLGAGQGIGRQAAHALAQAGARVACVGRDRERTEAVAHEVGGFALVGDAGRRDHAERMFAEAEAYGGALHGVVDILGMPRIKPFLEFSDEDWDWQFSIVLRHAFYALQLGGRALGRAGGGSIVLVGSTAGVTVPTHQAVYGAAKAALHHLAAQTAVELGPLGVRVNVVAPGATRTPRLQAALTEAQWEAVARDHVVGRPALPADIASTILFLASDMGRHLTGQTLIVDGGSTIKPHAPAISNQPRQSA